MNSRRHLGVVAGAATMLSAAPLSLIFEQWNWFFRCLMAVGLIVGAATLARSLRAPVWAQVLAMSGTLLLVLTWLHPSDGEFLSLVPTPDTFAAFGGLLDEAVQDMRGYGVPVPDRPGLLFLTVLGVGAVAIIVDVVTVSMRRPALAGLPMLAIYSVPVAVYPENVSPIPFIIGAAGFLWLLVADNVDRVRRFGRRFTGDGRDVDVWEPSPLAAAGRRLAVVGVLLAVAIPLAAPSMGSGLITALGPGAGGTGPGDGPPRGASAVDLFAELSGRLNQAEVQDLIRVTTDESRPYYLRFAVADQVGRNGFRARGPRGSSVVRGLGDPQEISRPGVSTQRFRARVEITRNFNMPMLPTYATPVDTDGVDSSWLYDPEAQIVYSNRSNSSGREYEFDYVRSRYDPAALRRAPSVSPTSAVGRAYTTVPPVREVGELVNELTRGADNDYDKTRALYDHFSAENGFRYSLEASRGTSGSAIVDFLENKTGFCEQYAAALAWLVRAAGIPARVAFGLTNGNNRSGNTFTLTNRNLHAWTEVYFTGFGWVPFDATPTANVAGSVVSAWAPDTNRPPETDPSAGPSAAPGPDSTAAPGPGAGGRLDEGSEGQSGAIPVPNANTWPLWLAGGAILLLFLLAVPALRRALLRRRRVARAPAGASAAGVAGMDAEPSPGQPWVMVTGDREAVRADAHAAWDELLDTMVDFRVPVDPTETPRATAERLVGRSRLSGDAADGARLLGRAEERARYARDPLQSGQLAAALRAVRRALADGATRRQRLLATFMPPSVVLRWRLALVDLGTRAVLTGGRWRERLVRLSPRRALAARVTR